MLTFLAFICFGLYHVYVTNPAAFNTIKMMTVFSILHAQMFVEHAVTEGKKLWNTCEIYVKKNMVPREKIFSNEHIMECRAISYCLDRDPEHPTKNTYKFSQNTMGEGASITKDTMVVTEIVFDNLETVRLISSPRDTMYSMKDHHKKIDEKFSSGYPTREKCPFMCVEILYNDNRYDITSLLKEYLYIGNSILSFPFIRMFMFEHLGVYIKPGDSVTLYTVDHHVNTASIEFYGHENHTHYDYMI